MKMPVQEMLVSFIKQKPGAQMRDIIRGLPELHRSSISSTLPVLVRQGLLIRKVGKKRRYEYCACSGEPKLLVVEQKTQNQPPVQRVTPCIGKTISPDEWKKRFKKVQELESKGLSRRAARLSLELLDVTGDERLRERLISFKCGYIRAGAVL